MKFWVGLTALAMLTCGLGDAKAQSAAEMYASATDARSFWIRDLNVTSGGQAAEIGGGFQECVADQFVALSTPAMTAAVDRFVTTKSEENYSAILALEGKETLDETTVNRVVDDCFAKVQ